MFKVHNIFSLYLDHVLIFCRFYLATVLFEFSEAAGFARVISLVSYFAHFTASFEEFPHCRTWIKYKIDLHDDDNHVWCCVTFCSHVIKFNQVTFYTVTLILPFLVLT